MWAPHRSPQDYCYAQGWLEVAHCRTALLVSYELQMLKTWRVGRLFFVGGLYIQLFDELYNFSTCERQILHEHHITLPFRMKRKGLGVLDDLTVDQNISNFPLPCFWVHYCLLPMPISPGCVVNMAPARFANDLGSSWFHNCVQQLRSPFQSVKSVRIIHLDSRYIMEWEVGLGTDRWEEIDSRLQ